jgi:hypothetical protein
MPARRGNRVAFLAATSIAVAGLTGFAGSAAFADGPAQPVAVAVQPDVAAAPATAAEQPQTRDYCSGNIRYPAGTWGTFSRQGITSNTNPTPMWFYQDGKRGPSSAKSGGGFATGGKGMTYCGNNFAYSASSSL